MKEEVRKGDKGTRATPLEALVDAYASRPTLSPRTKESYTAGLSRFAAFLDPGGVLIPREITKAHVNAYAASFDEVSERTRSDSLRVLKAFFAWLCSENLLLTNPASHLSIPRPSTLAPMPLGEREVVRLLNAPDTGTVLGLRDRAFLEALYGTGMRVGELVSLDLQDVELSEKLCFIRKGKGGKGRWVPLTEEAAHWLRAYLEASRPRLYKKKISGRLFLSMHSPGLGRSQVEWLCRRYAQQAGITRRVWPHLLRHTAACHLLENGASLFHVQALLGHALAVTTQRYTHVTTRHLMEAYRCHPRA
jgi:integrase/recombinase XerD